MCLELPPDGANGLVVNLRLALAIRAVRLFRLRFQHLRDQLLLLLAGEVAAVHVGGEDVPS